MSGLFGWGLKTQTSKAAQVIVDGWNTTALEAASMTFSNSNKTVVGNNNGGFGNNRCLSLASKTSGKRFGSIRIDAYEFGDTSVSDDTDANYVHYDYAGVVYASTGVTLANLAGYSAPAVMDHALDIDNLLVWFRLNGGNWNGNASYDPATGVGGFPLPASAGAWHLKAQMPYFPASQRTINCGSSAFTYPAPAGFLPLGY